MTKAQAGLVRHLWRQAKRVVVILVGAGVLLVGIALLVLPGPALIVIPVGLGILGTQFVWAKRLWRKALAIAKTLERRIRETADTIEEASPQSMEQRMEPEALFVTILRQGKRALVILIGITLVLSGMALIVLPGPAIVIIAAGLAVLGTQFVWAGRFRRRILQMAKNSSSSSSGETDR